MSNSDGDAEPERRSNIRFDDWPIQDYATWENWTVERETTSEQARAQDTGVEWIGFVGGAGGEAFVYDQEQSAIYRGDVDEENERVVLDQTHSEAEDEESLGERLEEIGDEHGWTWLSSFAREHLEDEETEDYRVPEGVDREHSEFQRRNVLEDAEPDFAFFGSHTFSDATDRKHMLERDFDVYLEEAGDDAVVHVIERYLVAEEPNAERREGDAEIADEREYELAVEADPDDPAMEGHVEGTLEQWHERHIAPAPTDAPVEA